METIKGYVDHIIYRNEDNTYTVHCLDESMAEGINQSNFADMLKEIEEH